MKAIATVIAAMFAATVFAAEPAKAPATPASAPAKAEVKKDEKKPAKVGLSIIGGAEAGYDVSTGLQYVIAEPRVIVGLKLNQNRVGLGFGFIYGHSLN